MTDEKTRALIAEAERRTSEWSDPAEMPSDVKLVGSLATALSALTAPDRNARPKVITEDGRYYAEFKGGDVIECSSPEDAEATAEAWRRWPNGGHPPVDEHRGAWRTGFVDGAEWALSRAAAPEEPDDEPCKAETHSWSHYQPEQIDSYWIRCTRLGEHDEHEDSHTGLRWRAALPVGGETDGE